MHGTVHAAALAAATNGVRAFLDAELQPVMRTSVAALLPLSAGLAGGLVRV